MRDEVGAVTVPDTREPVLRDEVYRAIRFGGLLESDAGVALAALAARVEELTEALRPFADAGRRYYSNGDRLCIAPLAWVMAAEAVLVRESGGQR